MPEKCTQIDTQCYYYSMPAWILSINAGDTLWGYLSYLHPSLEKKIVTVTWVRLEHIPDSCAVLYYAIRCQGHGKSSTPLIFHSFQSVMTSGVQNAIYPASPPSFAAAFFALSQHAFHTAITSSQRFCIWLFLAKQYWILHASFLHFLCSMGASSLCFFPLPWYTNAPVFRLPPILKNLQSSLQHPFFHLLSPKQSPINLLLTCLPGDSFVTSLQFTSLSLAHCITARKRDIKLAKMQRSSFVRTLAKRFSTINVLAEEWSGPSSSSSHFRDGIDRIEV